MPIGENAIRSDKQAPEAVRAFPNSEQAVDGSILEALDYLDSQIARTEEVISSFCDRVEPSCRQNKEKEKDVKLYDGAKPSRDDLNENKSLSAIERDILFQIGNLRRICEKVVEQHDRLRI